MADDLELRQKVPGDIIPNKEDKDPGFDEDHLSSYVLRTFKDAIADKEEFGWREKRAYDVKSYYGLKDARLSNWPWKNACLDDKTEVFTDRGWKLFDNLDMKHRVYSMNPDTGISEYMEVQALQKFKPPIPELLRLSGKSVDLFLTPNHRLLVRSDLNGKITFRQAFDFLKIRGNEFTIPLSSKWIGISSGKIYGFAAEDWFEFLGWYISEGWTFGSGTIGIAQSFKANPKKCFEIECLLSRMGTT